MYGIAYDELPLLNYSLVMKGGHLQDKPELAGTAYLVASLMTEGTANKTPEELEEAIEMLGANIRVSASQQAISINVNTLARNFESTLALVEEILFEPRWDEEQFELAKSRVINSHKRNMANPSYLARNTLNKLLFGEESLLAIPVNGTIETIEAITIEDLKEYYSANFSPGLSSFHLVGNIPQAEAKKTLAGIESRWEPKEVYQPDFQIPDPPEKSEVYFVDVPGAKQSVIQIGTLGLSRTHPDYDAVQAMNYKLGGSFSGFLNLILREEKGFTYGARSGFYGNELVGTFQASSSVRSNATLESMQIFMDEMSKYRDGISQEDLDFTKDAMLKSNARQFETLWALQGMLETISRYNLPFDYIKKQQEVTRNMSLEDHKNLAGKYIHPDQMYYVVVGDAASQLEPLKTMGLGTPKLYN
jgi:zinc protease